MLLSFPRDARYPLIPQGWGSQLHGSNINSTLVEGPHSGSLLSHVRELDFVPLKNHLQELDSEMQMKYLGMDIILH